MKGKKNSNYKDGRSLKKRGVTRARYYEKGKRNEKKAWLALEKLNYHVVRSGGSKGCWDLVAVSLDKDPKVLVRLVQVKSNTAPRRIEIKKMREFPVHNKSISKELWIYRDWVKEPEVQIL